MSFFTQALKKAESFLENVDESVANASKRLAFDKASLTSSIPINEYMKPMTKNSSTSVINQASESLSVISQSSSLAKTQSGAVHIERTDSTKQGKLRASRKLSKKSKTSISTPSEEKQQQKQQSQQKASCKVEENLGFSSNGTQSIVSKDISQPNGVGNETDPQISHNGASNTVETHLDENLSGDDLPSYEIPDPFAESSYGQEESNAENWRDFDAQTDAEKTDKDLEHRKVYIFKTCKAESSGNYDTHVKDQHDDSDVHAKSEKASNHLELGSNHSDSASDHHDKERIHIDDLEYGDDYDTKEDPNAAISRKVSSIAESVKDPSENELISSRNEQSLRNHIAALEKENEELHRELDFVEDALYLTREEKDEFESKLKRVKTELEESIANNSQLRDELKQALNAVKMERDRAVKAEQTLITEVTSYSQKLDIVNKDKSDIEFKINKEIQEFKTKVSFLEQDNERLKNLIKNERDRDLTSTDEAHRETARALEQLEAEIAAHNETRLKAQLREEFLEQSIEAANEAVIAAEKRMEENRNTVTEAQTRVHEAENRSRQNEMTNMELISKLERAETVMKDQSNKLQEWGRLTDIEKKFKEASENLKLKNGEVVRLRQELDKVSNKLKIERDKNWETKSTVGLEAQFEELQLQIRTLADSNIRKQAQLELLKGENRALCHQIYAERKRTIDAQNMASIARPLSRSEHSEDVEKGHANSSITVKYIPSRSTPKYLSKLLETFDKLVISALTFLRVEPFIRIAFFVYILFMHLFIYIVLHHTNDSRVDSSSSNLPGME